MKINVNEIFEQAWRDVEGDVRDLIAKRLYQAADAALDNAMDAGLDERVAVAVESDIRRKLAESEAAVLGQDLLGAALLAQSVGGND